MPNYLLTYHGGGGMAATEAEQARIMETWGKWFQDLGDHLVDGGLPIARTASVAADGTVNQNGGISNPVSGYSVIKADSIDDALKAAKMCPVLASGGTIEVGETIPM